MIFLIRGYIPLFPISKIIETHSHFLHLSAPAVQAVKPIRIVPGHSRSGPMKKNDPFTREDQTRFTMRIDTELLEQIKAEAEKNKRSAATEIE